MVKILASYINDIDAAYDAAIASLKRCITPFGVMASGAKLGHHQVWARDCIITLLGARFVPDKKIREAFEISLETLKKNSSALGAVPNNVSATGKSNFRAYADAGLWWVIGSSLLAPDLLMIRLILRWYECHDIDQSSLLSMQESADWQDLFCTRGKGLYLNCLYVLALRFAAKACALLHPDEHILYEQKAEQVSHKINRWLWYRGDSNMLWHISHSFSTESLEEYDSLGRKRWLPEKQLLKEEEYYLPYLGFRAVGEWFDSLGNLLAILSGVSSPESTDKILNFIAKHHLAHTPIKAIYPTILPGDTDWRDYYGTLNLPHCYHNSGIWPFIGGFYVAALVKAGRFDEAEDALLRLSQLNLAGNFNEWHHGETAAPLGVEHQAWSAGMYLLAYECVKQKQVML